MALIGNYSVLNKSLAQFTNGTSTAGAYAGITPSNYQNNGLFVNRYASYAKFNATPVGYLPPYSFVLPLNSGGLGSQKQMSAAISETLATLVSGINIDAGLSGSITITQAQLDQIVELVAAITGSITTTDAQLAAVSELIASISASMTITDAQLGAIVDMIAALTGTFNLTNANNFATADIEADLSVTTGTATPAQIAAEVWSAVATDNNTAGTMGEKLNDAGAAGNPWAADLADNVTPGTFGAFIQKLLTVAKFLGLK